MSWDRYAIAVVFATGAVFLIPAATVTAAIYIGRHVRNQRARSTR